MSDKKINQLIIIVIFLPTILLLGINKFNDTENVKSKLKIINKSIENSDYNLVIKGKSSGFSIVEFDKNTGIIKNTAIKDGHFYESIKQIEDTDDNF